VSRPPVTLLASSTLSGRPTVTSPYQPPSSDQPSYESNPYGQPTYGQPTYGQAPYGQPTGQPGYGYGYPPPPYQPYPQPAPGNGLGIAGFVVALIGTVFFWIPIFGFVLGAVGLILSVTGMQQGKRTGASSGLAIAGLVLGILATIGGLTVTIAVLAS
jgi:hypothetical protein